MKVYLAGKVTKPDGTYDDWREKLIGSVIPRERYIGPHVTVNPEGRPWCMEPGPCVEHADMAGRAIESCDIFIAVLNTPDCYNTLVELGYAAGINKLTAAWVGKWATEIADLRSVLHWSKVCDRGLYSVEQFLSNCMAIESPIEWLMFGALNEMALRVTPQFKVGKYRVDFLIDGTNICVELDGHEYHKTKEQRTRDAKREREIESLGYRVVRFTGSEVFRDPIDCAYDVFNVYAEYQPTQQRKQ